MLCCDVQCYGALCLLLCFLRCVYCVFFSCNFCCVCTSRHIFTILFVMLIFLSCLLFLFYFVLCFLFVITEEKWQQFIAKFRRALADLADATRKAVQGIVVEYSLIVDKDSFFEKFSKLSSDAYERHVREAQFLLAWLLLRGGVEIILTRLEDKDSQAIALYRLAAAQGCLPAINGMGVLHEDGCPEKIPKDLVRATEFYRLAAEGGYPPGQYNLARMYDEGLGGLPRDHVQAVALYQSAAEKGDSASMNNLAAAWEEGRGVSTKDEWKALEYYGMASNLFRI